MEDRDQCQVCVCMSYICEHACIHAYRRGGQSKMPGHFLNQSLCHCLDTGSLKLVVLASWPVSPLLASTCLYPLYPNAGLIRCTEATPSF